MGINLNTEKKTDSKQYSLAYKALVVIFYICCLPFIATAKILISISKLPIKAAAAIYTCIFLSLVIYTSVYNHNHNQIPESESQVPVVTVAENETVDRMMPEETVSETTITTVTTKITTESVTEAETEPVTEPETEPVTEPEPETEAPVVVREDPRQRTVYIAASGNGKKYHYDPYCSKMNNNVISMTVEEAEASGYSLCGKE